MKRCLVAIAWLLLFLPLCSYRAPLTTAAEPLKFAEPLNIGSERLGIMNRFAVARAKSQSNPEALAAAEAQRDDALRQLAAAAEAAHSTEHVLIAQLYLETKRYDDAARVARAAIEANAADLPSHFVLISTLCRAKRADEAAAAFGQLTALNIAELDAKVYLRDSRPAAAAVAELLLAVGKADHAQQMIGAWQGQLEKFQPQNDTQRELTVAKVAAATLSGTIITKKSIPVASKPPIAAPNKPSGLIAETLAAKRAADVIKPSAAPVLPSTAAAAALKAKIATQKGSSGAAQAEAAEQVKPTKPAEPDRPGSSTPTLSEKVLAAKRAADAIKSSAAAVSPPTAADALKAKIAAQKEGSGAAHAEAAEQAKPTKAAEPNRPGSNTPTLSEKIAAAKRAARAAGDGSTSPLAARALEAAKMIEESKSRAGRAQEITVASQLREINAKYARSLPSMKLQPMSPDEIANSSEEEQRRHKEKVEAEWRENPQRQKAEAEWIAALTQLAAEAEAAQTIEHAALAQVYNVLNRNEEAIRHAQSALEQQPADKISRALLVRLLLRSERWDDAIHQWQAGLEQNPADSEAQVVLLRTLCNLGRIDEAQKAYRMWLDLDVSAADIKNYLEPVLSGTVSVFVVKLIQSNRFAEADQALDDLLAKVRQLQTLSRNQTATVSAKAVLDDLKGYVAKSSKETGVPPRSVKPQNVGAK